jgi:MoaA/NifB/PqqE/SkfB family radical SAM enzyme
MRFPLRLTADLTITKIARTFQMGNLRPIVVRVNFVDASVSSALPAHPLSSPAKTEDEILATALATPAPIVWLGGGEPLLHPQIGHIARKIADRGRNVFVETDGALLRQRIFSFRPVSRLFLCVSLYGPEAVHDSHVGRVGVFRAAIAGIHAAKLSGFYVCALTEISQDSELSELAELSGLLGILDVDGWIVVPAPRATSRAEMPGKLREARELIQNRGWEKFSRLLDLSPPVASARTQNATDIVQLEAAEAQSDPEGVPVP